MNREEWAVYESKHVGEPTISGDEFDLPDMPSPDRLLCRGWNLNGGPNVRIWLNWEGEIGRQYNDDEIVWKSEWPMSELIPTKRAYREDTDLQFAMAVRERNELPLSFTTWRDET